MNSNKEGQNNKKLFRKFLLALLITLILTPASLLIKRAESVGTGTYDLINFYWSDQREYNNTVVEKNIKNGVEIDERCTSGLDLTDDNTIRNQYGAPMAYLYIQKIEDNGCENIVYLLEWKRLSLNFLFYIITLFLIFPSIDFFVRKKSVHFRGHS